LAKYTLAFIFHLIVEIDAIKWKWNLDLNDTTMWEDDVEGRSKNNPNSQTQNNITKEKEKLQVNF
jgi:hypothetical protein